MSVQDVLSEAAIAVAGSWFEASVSYCPLQVKRSRFHVAF